ncbi:MAG: toll/interleukin-1 receptor domain-containing protein [Litorimonas sp.]
MTYIYGGFLSYAHADEAAASRLHKALETYKIPKGHTGTLSPIFRDTTELTAHHSLSEKIQGAVTGSRVLIVLCSPAAKVSHWVNEEIRLFREIHGEAAILCVLAEGTPETAFPPALLEGGREPLAANLGDTKESFRLGVTQIAAAMLGVGLDTLIQRETRRKRRRLQAVTASALVFSGLMGATTLSAVTARKAAEDNRMQAEGLVEYMIEDLKAELEPVGRLDILAGIGDRAVEYYDAQDISKLPDDSLARQARARHILGQVALDTGEFDKARDEIEAAARLTKEVFNRNPDDTEAIFSHAQSEYWVGLTHYKLNNVSKALPHWQAYADLGAKLNEIEPTQYDWIMERGWGENNLALLANRENDFQAAQAKYLEAITHFENAVNRTNDNYQAQKEIANSLGGLAQVTLGLGNIEQTTIYRQRQSKIYRSLLQRRPNDFYLRNVHAQALSRLVTEGLLDEKPEELAETILKTCSEFERLIEHDKDNQIWKNNYHLSLNGFLNRAEKFNLAGVDREDLKNRITALEAR